MVKENKIVNILVAAETYGRYGDSDYVVRLYTGDEYEVWKNISRRWSGVDIEEEYGDTPTLEQLKEAVKVYIEDCNGDGADFIRIIDLSVANNDIAVAVPFEKEQGNFFKVVL